METIYDTVLEKVVPINQATTEGIRNFLNSVCDDGYIEHNMILECIIELEKRGE